MTLYKELAIKKIILDKSSRGESFTDEEIAYIKNPTNRQSSQKKAIIDKLNKGEVLTDAEIARYLTDRDSIPLKVIPNYT